MASHPGDSMSDPLVEQLNRAFDTLADQVRVVMAEHASVRLEQLSAAIQAERQTIAEKARLDATAATRQAVTERLTADFARLEEQIREETRTQAFDAGLKQGRAEAAGELQAQRAEAVARLSRALRTLDGSTSLSQTLSTLVEAAGTEARKTALFLVRGDVLRLWSQSGYDTLDAQPAFEFPLADAGIIADAVRASEPRLATESRPPFSTDLTAAFVTVPLALNGQVTAVLCAEDARAGEGTELASTLDVLARHAARVLECLTALRLAHAGGRPAAGVAAGM
jgi:hypothetical protein